MAHPNHSEDPTERFAEGPSVRPVYVVVASVLWSTSQAKNYLEILNVLSEHPPTGTDLSSPHEVRAHAGRRI